MLENKCGGGEKKVATNINASWLPECQLTATLPTCAKSLVYNARNKGPKRKIWVKKILKIHLGQKNLTDGNNFWSENNVGFWKRFSLKKCSVPKQMWVPKENVWNIPVIWYTNMHKQLGKRVSELSVSQPVSKIKG